MLADWSSIWTGFGIVWAGIALYGLSIYWRLHRAGGARQGSWPVTHQIDSGRGGDSPSVRPGVRRG